jgi:hypothetical protein
MGPAVSRWSVEALPGDGVIHRPHEHHITDERERDG